VEVLHRGAGALRPRLLEGQDLRRIGRRVPLLLDARAGTLVWKFRGAPPDRPDRRQIGNGHLVSFWPVAGRARDRDGVVYFGAGLWATFAFSCTRWTRRRGR